MDDKDRNVLALHAKRSMARLVYKMRETQRFGVLHWFGQWEPDLEQVRVIEDRERARHMKARDDQGDTP